MVCGRGRRAPEEEEGVVSFWEEKMARASCRRDGGCDKGSEGRYLCTWGDPKEGDRSRYIGK